MEAEKSQDVHLVHCRHETANGIVPVCIQRPEIRRTDWVSPKDGRLETNEKPVSQFRSASRKRPMSQLGQTGRKSSFFVTRCSAYRLHSGPLLVG